jgi:hypothetical protein
MRVSPNRISERTLSQDARGFVSLPRPWRWVVVILFALAALALVGQFLVYVHYAVSLFHFPFDYDQGEGFELYDTVLHARGEWPYRDSQVFPFYTSIYPPLFHLMTVPLVWVFGPQMWTGRAVGFAASLITAGAIGWGVQQASGNRVIALFSGLTFLASNDVFHIGPLFRQHMTMVMFETLGIVALAQLDCEVLNREGAKDAKKTECFAPFAPLRFHTFLLLGLFFLLAAGYTKPLALTTVLAGMTFLFLHRPRQALLAGSLLALVGGSLFLWLNDATEGWWSVSIIRANINRFDLAQALKFYRQWMSLHLILLGVTLTWLMAQYRRKRVSAYALWFILAFASGLLSGKAGAGEAYFVTATAAVSMTSGIAVAERLTRSQAWSPRRVVISLILIPVLYLIQTRLTLHLYTSGPIYGPMARVLGVAHESGYYDSQGKTQLGPRPTEEDVRAGQAIAELARQARGPVLSEEAGFLLRAGKSVVSNPFPQKMMYEAGLFDPSQEIAMIENKVFGLVILRAQFYPDPVMVALETHYQPLADISMNRFLYHVLEPRP